MIAVLLHVCNTDDNNDKVVFLQLRIILR